MGDALLLAVSEEGRWVTAARKPGRNVLFLSDRNYLGTFISIGKSLVVRPSASCRLSLSLVETLRSMY